MPGRIILKQIGLFFAISVFGALAPALIYIDTLWLVNGVKEWSLTELTQELFLLITAVIFITSALRNTQWRAGLMLAGGFYLVLLIRELDYFFDFIRHGAWLWFALSATVITLAYAWRHRTTIAPGLVALIRHPGFGYLMSGLVCVLVFSRLFGMSALWKNVLTDGYAYQVKASIEEGVELLGYSLNLFAALYWRFAPAQATSVAYSSVNVAHRTARSIGDEEYSWE